MHNNYEISEKLGAKGRHRCVNPRLAPRNSEAVMGGQNAHFFQKKMPLGKILANFQKNYKFCKFGKTKFAKILQKVTKISVARFRKNWVFSPELCIFPGKAGGTKLGKIWEIWEIWENFTQKKSPDTHV